VGSGGGRFFETLPEDGLELGNQPAFLTEHERILQVGDGVLELQLRQLLAFFRNPALDFFRAQFSDFLGLHAGLPQAL
jgi:hypothetical protein